MSLDDNMSIDFEDSDITLPKVEPTIGLKMCASTCLQFKEECPFRECKHWIEHQGDLNCDLISIHRYRRNES